MNSRLPIYHDDFSFHDRQSRMFDDMRRQMSSPFRSNKNLFDNDMNRLSDDFFQLRPMDPVGRVRRSDDLSNSRENLDENALRSLFIEDPNTKSRVFQISFDVKDYDADKVSVKMQNDQLVVEAKCEKEQNGNKLINEFSRKVQIPKEVDADKLSSTLSSDGILTISAPVPPKYQSIANGNDNQGRDSPKQVTSPALAPTQGRNSPSLKIYPGRNSPTLSSPQPATTPKYKKQIYMVPSPVRSPTVSPHVPHSSSPLFQQNGGGVPVTVQTTARPRTPPLDTPTFYNTERGCEMVLVMDIGPPYTPDDLLVKVDGRILTVEAEHVETMNGRKSKSSFSREFEMSQSVNPTTVTALLKEGRLKITGLAQ